MNSLIVALNVVLPMFSLMLVGYILKKANFFDDKTLKQLNYFVFSILISSSLYKSIITSSIQDSLNVKLVVLSIFGLILGLIIGYFLAIKNAKAKNQIPVIWQGIFRGNNALYGLAVIQFLYNVPSLASTSSIVAIIAPIVNIACVIVFSLYNGTKLEFKSLFISIIKNPMIISIVLGFTTLLLKISLPSFVSTCVSQLASAANPLGLIVLGASFKFEQISDNLKILLKITLYRNIILPIFIITLGVIIGLRGEYLAGLIVIFCVPTALSSYATSASLGGDKDLAAQIVMITTIASVFTVFGFIFTLNLFALI